jgi:two-component system response regulator HydG
MGVSIYTFWLVIPYCGGTISIRKVCAVPEPDLHFDELISHADGLLSLHGRRLILHDVHAMAQLRKDLFDAVGVEHAKTILSRFGFYWGEADAAAIKRIFNWDDLADWLRAGPRLHEIQGTAKARVKSLDVDPDGKLRMEVLWENSAEAEEQLLEMGASPDAGCWILLGYASGYATFCIGRPVYFVEEKCRGRGNHSCVAIGMDSESWGDRAESLAKNYRVEDIQSKVEELTTALRKKTLELARERRRLREMKIDTAVGMPESQSREFLQVLDMSRRVARFDSSVLITGESGVGKEVVARFIHDHSLRSKREFVAINCGALPESLLESELFGHVRGSFTGAIRDRAGLFEQARGGTILLDEIGDIPLQLQVKLLRVLQDHNIRRVGEDTPRDIDCRVIAATNRSLQDDLREGRFREDLYYRLRVVEIHIPPLRERTDDILPLARLFTERLAKRLKLRRLALHPTSLELLERYSWPGNVRELENALERAAVMSDDEWIRPEHLPIRLSEAELAGGALGTGRVRPLAEVERDYVLGVLKLLNGNRSKTARSLGMSTTTLWRKLKEWGENI